MKLRFIGVKLEITGYPVLETFGQSITLPDALAREMLAPVPGSGLEQRSAPLLTEVEFEGIGFTPDDLKAYADIGTHADAPAAFLTKKKAALALLATAPKPKGEK